MSLMIDPASWARRRAAEEADYFDAGQAHGMLNKEGAAPVAAPVLHGRLTVGRSGWALLSVPNSLVHGLIDAMHEPGVELPPGHEGGAFNAHISVLTKDEVDRIGGPDKITERGHTFNYQLGPVKSVAPKGWSDMSRAWFVTVQSPELKALRKSYGLSPLPNGDHDFHCTIAVRRKNVLGPNEVSKAAAADDKDEKDGPKATIKAKMPLVIRRIAVTETRITSGDDADDGIKEFMDLVRSRGEKKAAAARSLARLAGEKRADGDFDFTPALIGAGIGGVGNWGLGRLFSSKQPIRDALTGASLGGLAGLAAGGGDAFGDSGIAGLGSSVTVPELPAITPANTTSESLADNVRDYYKDAPGGFEEALDRAVANQQSASPAIPSPAYTEEDVNRKFPVTSADPLPPNRRPGLGQAAVSGWTRRSAGDPPIRIGLTDPGDLYGSEATPPMREQTKEHELTHAALLYSPQDRSGGHVPDAHSSGQAMLESMGYTGDDLSKYNDYALSPDELDPRLAQVKRFFVQSHKGEHVDSPDQARKALDWFRGWVHTPDGQKSIGREDAAWWGRVFADPKLDRAIQAPIIRRMPSLVDLGLADRGTKAAAVMPASMRKVAAGLDRGVGHGPYAR